MVDILECQLESPWGQVSDVSGVISIKLIEVGSPRLRAGGAQSQGMGSQPE